MFIENGAQLSQHISISVGKKAGNLEREEVKGMTRAVPEVLDRRSPTLREFPYTGECDPCPHNRIEGKGYRAYSSCMCCASSISDPVGVSWLKE